MSDKKSQIKIESNCPIPNTHRRLEQAHALWHQTLSSYHSPDLFQANLNSTIETLRNVTFMLQNEKHIIPDFDVWYDSWRDKMKVDQIMKWLVDARTTIVHKSDLETFSIARAIIHNNLTLATYDIDIPPFAPLESVYLFLCSMLPEPFASNKKDLVASIERRWCVPDLPNEELLDALAHAYSILTQIVTDAHQRSGFSFGTIDHNGNQFNNNENRLPCMIDNIESRRIRMSLNDGIPFIPGSIPIKLNAEIARKAEKRYKTSRFIQQLSKLDDPFEKAEAFIPIAKKILQKDKHHIRLILLHNQSGWNMVPIAARNRIEKFAIMRDIASEVKRNQIDALIHISEVWISSVDEYEAGRMPEDAIDRKEALNFCVATSAGKIRNYTVFFNRSSNGNILFSDTIIDESKIPTYLAPIYEAWGLPINNLY